MIIEAILESDPEHPRFSEINEMVESLEQAMTNGDPQKLEGMTVNLIQVLNEVEAATAG